MNAALALLVAVCCATVSSVLFAMIQGRLVPLDAYAALLLGAIAGLAILIRGRAERLKLNLSTTLMLVLFGLFALRGFCWLIFFKDNDICVLSPNNLGDMSLHLTYINYLASGVKFWPENPIFSGAQVHYPLGMDLFNALLKIMGVNVVRGLIWTGLTGSVITALALRRWGGAFAIAGFLFNGGLAGYHFFEHFRFADYNDAVAWKSIPLSMFVTQHGLIYAIPVGLFLLSSWREKWFRQRDETARLPFAVEVLLFSTLPLFHLHTFLFLSVLLGSWGLACRQARAGVIKLLTLSFVPATCLVVLVTGLLQHGSAAGRLIHIVPGWMQGTDNFFVFWFLNFGLLPLFILALLWVAVKNFGTYPEARVALAFVAPSLVVFLITCYVMLAPWAWDNTKVMIWCYLTILPFLWKLLIKKFPPVWKVAACLVLFFSGFVSLWGGIDRSHHGYDIAQRSELDSVSYITKGIPADETFAAYPTYNHPLLLCGHKLVEGYDGHLYSHGIDYGPQLEKLNFMMKGEPGWRAVAHDLHARYLFWGKREKEHYPRSTTPWRATCTLVATGSWGELYDLAN